MTQNLPSISTNLLPAHQEFQMFQTIARSAKSSGLYGGDENKIFMVLLAARELGIPPMQALNGGIWNIQGKVEISARLMNSMIRRAGHTMKITSTATECVIQGKRADTGEEHTESFTMQMAINAGLANGNVWKKYPEDMLYNRCMSRLARRLFPDVIGIAYVEGEIKEAKEVENQERERQTEILTPCPYEDVTPEQNTLTAEHISIIKEYLSKITGACKANFLNYFSVTEENLHKIPESQFNAIINSFNINIEMQKNENNQS